MTIRKPNLRWVQYGSRALLVAALCAIPWNWLALNMQQAKQQREAVAAIRKIDGLFVGVAYDYQFDASGNSVNNPQPPGPAWLRNLLGEDFLASVESVDLSYTQGTDDALENLKGLTQLKHLNLHNGKVTDDGLENLKELNELRGLGLGSTQITDAGLENLKGLTQLHKLYLMETQVTDVGLEHLRGLSQLQELDLSSTKVTDEGVKKLQRALPSCKITR